MSAPPDDGERTVRIRPDIVSVAARRNRRLGAAFGGGAALAIALAGAAGWEFWGRELWPARASVSLPQPLAGAPVSHPATAFPVTTATVEQVRRNDPFGVSVFRLAENPQIIVLDFASLPEQGRMLDRIAALTEKTALPRNRIVDAQELSRAIQSEGGPDPWFYYGHDYDGAAIRRFFAVAAQSQVTLTPEEERLRQLAGQLGLLEADSQEALISIPRVGADSNVTAGARDAILMHEMSHGEYFTNPDYARHVRQFWFTALTEQEREAFRAYLEGQGYDRSNQQIMENETQAYLLFTPDPRFFLSSQVGMSAERRAQLRSVFLRDMPQGWLRSILEGLP